MDPIGLHYASKEEERETMMERYLRLFGTADHTRLFAPLTQPTLPNLRLYGEEQPPDDDSPHLAFSSSLPLDFEMSHMSSTPSTSNRSLVNAAAQIEGFHFNENNDFVSNTEKSSSTDTERQSSRPSDEESQKALEVKHDIGGGPIQGEEHDTTEYPNTTQLIFITIALCLSVFCMALDNTIISTAIPRITDEFHSINDVGWYGSAYLLTQSAFQLLAGKMYTFFSVKWTYLFVLGIFEVGSAVCGAAPNSTALIVGRAVAGLGASGIFCGAMLIVASAVPLKKRPAYTGLIGGVYGVASVAGPLMGGAFTDKVTWRWCFYINLPIGAVTVIFILLFYHPKKDARAQSLGRGWRAKLDQLDIFGTLAFLPMIICLLLALQWGGSRYPWSDGRIIALFVIFGVLLIAFIGIQLWKKDNATVPPRVIKQRSIAAGAWFIFCLGAAFVLFTYYLPIWFQAIKDVSPVQSGIRNIPMILSLVVITMASGIAVTVFGYYAHFFILSSIFAAIGAGLISTWQVDTGSGKWIGYQIILGSGVGFGIQQMLNATQVVLPRKDLPVGTALVMFFQTLGGSLFLSVAQSVFSNKLLAELERTVPQVDGAAVVSGGATAFRDTVPEQYLPGVISAYNMAIGNAFYVGVAMAALSIFGALGMEWKSVKGRKTD